MNSLAINWKKVEGYGMGAGETKIGWFYFCIVAFMGGVFFRSLYDISLSVIVWLAMLAFVVAVVGRIGGRSPSATRLLFGSLILFCFSLGLLRMEWASWSVANPYLESQVGEQVSLEGVIRREPEARANSTHLYVKTEHGLILVTTPLGGSWQYGDSVLVNGKLQKPEEFETDLGRVFNYPGYLLAQGVSYRIGYAEVEKVQSG
ncbi:MAG: ComEC/Rec2 family competence protein, partial [Candidatus Paceibacterota bacterium]